MKLVFNPCISADDIASFLKALESTLSDYLHDPIPTMNIHSDGSFIIEESYYDLSTCVYNLNNHHKLDSNEIEKDWKILIKGSGDE